jgi:uncharacterized membrane protein
VKQIIRGILSRTFSRMTTYLAIFNFCLLCMWLYDSELGSIFKENGLAPGDVILIVMFSILLVSAVEMLILGLGKEE